MGNIVEIQVLNEKIILQIYNKDIVCEFDNVASFDLKTKKLISTGVRQEKFRENLPKTWNKYKGQLDFQPVFDSKSFDPAVAGMLLWESWRSISQKAVGNTIFRFQIRLELNILFGGYEELPAEVQREFEYILFSCLDVLKLSVNGKEKAWSRKNDWARWLLPVLQYIFILVSILISVLVSTYLVSTLSAAHLPSSLDFLLFILIVFGVLYIFGFIGDVVALLAWMFLLRFFIPKETLLFTLMYPVNFPRKAKVGKIKMFLYRLNFRTDR